MSRPLVPAWVLSVGAALRRSQAKTLAELVWGRPSRRNAPPWPTRAGRFVADHRVTVADGMAGVVARLARRKGVPLVVAPDRVEVRTFRTPVAAAAADGRSVPLVWHTYPEWGLHESQNNLEEGPIRLLRSLIPDRVRISCWPTGGSGGRNWPAPCWG